MHTVNDLNVRIGKNLATGEETGSIDMIITPLLESKIRELFEIEMMAGHREQLADGRAKWILSSVDPQKCRILTDVLQKEIEKANRPTPPTGPALHN